MKEILIKWEPIKNSNGKYFISSVELGREGLIVELYDLHNKNKKIKIWVDGYTSCYRSIDNNYCAKRCNASTIKNCLHAEWPFFIVENSNYFKWFYEQSLETTSEAEFKHFLIVGTNKTIEILNYFDPKVELL